MDPTQRRAAVAAWTEVSDEVEREVIRLARVGRVHPDPAVAAAAYGWAHVLLLEVAERRRERWWRRAFHAVETALGGEREVIEDWWEARRERRWAQLVVFATEHQPGDDR